MWNGLSEIGPIDGGSRSIDIKGSFSLLAQFLSQIDMGETVLTLLIMDNVTQLPPVHHPLENRYETYTIELPRFCL
jgi:hypothetical protein